MTRRHRSPTLQRDRLIHDLRQYSSNESSTEDQVLATVIHIWVGTRPEGPTLTKRELSEIVDDLGLEFDADLYNTVVPNLADHGVLSGFQKEGGPDWWVIRERDGEFPMGEDRHPAVENELERAIQHIQLKDPPQSADPSAIADGGVVTVTDDGETLREFVAGEFETPPSTLEDYLRRGHTNERQDKLNDLVDMIEDSEAFTLPDSFDKIVTKPAANNYHLTEAVLEEYNIR